MNETLILCPHCGKPIDVGPENTEVVDIWSPGVEMYYYICAFCGTQFFVDDETDAGGDAAMIIQKPTNTLRWLISIV
jgi:hypothetical protein